MNFLSTEYHRVREICGKLELIPPLWITLLFPHQAKVSTMTILNNNTEVLMPAEACAVLAHAMIRVALAEEIGIGYWEHRSIPS